MSDILQAIKRWFTKKVEIIKRSRLPYPHEGEVWWCYLGINIDIEVNGDIETFLRPVLIVRVFNTRHILVVPATKTQKNSKYYYKTNIDGKSGSLNLTQLRAISSKRLFNKIEKVDKRTLNEVKQQIKDLI